MHPDDGPKDMDELLARGLQPVPTGSAIGQAAGLSGLLAVFTGTISVLVAGAIVAGGVVLFVGGMVFVLPLLV